MFRTWRAPDGRVLVEGPRGKAEVLSYRILTADGVPVPDPHEYFLLEADGTLRHHHAERAEAYEDDVYGTTYQVVGAELRAYHSVIGAVPWRIQPDGTVPREDSERVQITGLVAVPATEVLGPDPEAALARARADYARRNRESCERDEAPYRAACEAFAAALDGYQADGPIELTFAYRNGVEIHDAAGTVLWGRPEGPPGRAKDLYDRLDRVLRDRYGARVGRFHVDDRDAPWWWWAPDL